MRLIDADKLIKNLNGAIERKGLSAEDKNKALWCAWFLDTIAQVSTVEAIPIEWLKEWSRLYLAPTKEYTDIIEDIIRDYREEQKK